MSDADTLPTFAGLGLRAAAPTGECAVSAAADVLGDRWTLLILREAFYGVGRFEDMQSDLGISRAVLSERLARLVREGLLSKRKYREPGQRARAAYVLTDAGRELVMVMMALADWGERTRGVPSPLRAKRRSDGAALRVGFITEDGEGCPLNQVRFSRG